MSENNINKADMDEKELEKENLKQYNEDGKGKVTPQNQHHNARKESFGQSQQIRYR